MLPAQRRAKFSFRLVPNQDPKKITAACERSTRRSYCPPGIELELTSTAAPGVVVPLDSPYVAAAPRAIERGFGQAPVFIREGGSIPIVTNFAQQLGVDTLLLGWGLDDDNTHSPNEKFSLADFHRGSKPAHICGRNWRVTTETQRHRAGNNEQRSTNDKNPGFWHWSFGLRASGDSLGLCVSVV